MKINQKRAGQLSARII